MIVNPVIGIRQNGWGGAKKNEYGGQSRGGRARHLRSPCLKHFRPRRSHQAPAYSGQQAKAHFCDRHHIASATAGSMRTRVARMTPIGTPELVLLLVALGGMTVAATCAVIELKKPRR